MIRLTRARRLGAALAASALVLTACGGGDEPSGEADDPNTSEESEPSAPEGDGVLTLGSLLPSTGDLAFLGPPEFAGVDLAIEDMNAAGGVLGEDVVDVDADSGDGTPDIAGAEVDKLLNADSDAIIGAAASGVSVSVIDKITGAGVVHFSPANTAAGFDTYDDNGLYFRTAPSDRLQGQVLANLAVEDGFSNVAIMARQDFYGEGLAEQVQTTLEEKGATVADFVLYAADAQNYTAEVNQIAGAKPDALVLIAPYLSMPPRARRLAAMHWALSPFVGYLPSREEASIKDEFERKSNRGFGTVTPRLLNELQRLVVRARRSLGDVAVPTLVIQSRDDNRIEPGAAEQSFDRLGADEKRFEWTDGGGHVITVDIGRERVLALTGEWLLARVGSGGSPSPAMP